MKKKVPLSGGPSFSIVSAPRVSMDICRSFSSQTSRSSSSSLMSPACSAQRAQLRWEMPISSSSEISG